LAGTLRASLPDVGVWSALAPPGWRVRGTLQANATLSGTRSAPQWSGTLGADDLAVRSVVEGVDLQDGRLRAVLRGNQIDVTELRLRGGRGSGARIAGFSGNRTAAPQDGGTLTATGTLRWGAAGEGLSGIAMNLQADANALQVLARADRQLSVSGQLRAHLEQGQITLRGALTADRATIILPDESTPRLGSDVVVRSAAKDREDAAKAQAAAKASQTTAARAETAKPLDLAVTFNLGNDFALHGHGITTRLTGEVQVRSSGSTTPGAPPRVTGEVRTDAGRYRAWGQMLDVETGLIRFNGPYDNPSLDILALRPNISVRAGVQVTGSAQAPRVKLYSDPDLPDAEKLSWVVLGRNAASGGAEAAVLQQAALALLGRGGKNNTAGNFASRVGLDEIGFKGPGTGEDATGAALTFGKRLSKDLYVTYERSLSGTLGTLYIFYDLTRRLTLRGQTGEKSAVDLIYTVKYD
jgi:translocation and assembly module TamB